MRLSIADGLLAALPARHALGWTGEHRAIIASGIETLDPRNRFDVRRDF